MKTFVGSDFHWGHSNIFKFCPETRAKYQSVEIMTELMISEWNAIAGNEDTVYILGDVAFLPARDAIKIVSQLNGRKILIEGNHDVKLLRDPGFKSLFAEIYSYHEIVHQKTKIVMCHYPIYDHNQSARGSIMLHGHRHGKPHGIPGRIMDVGLDATGVILTDLDDIVSKMQSVPCMSHH